MEFRSFILCLLSILFLSSLHAQATTTFKYCADDENYSVKVSAIEITPDPIVRTENITFKISATAGEPISGGKWVIGVKFFGLVVVHKETLNLCERVSCPVTAGNFELTHTQKLPPFVPMGTYFVDMTLKNEKEKPLTCITFKIVL